MKAGKLQTQSSIAGDCWQLIYSTTLTEAATSLTISNLDGDTDKEYMLICRFVNNYNGATSYYLRLNNDSGSNYGYQYINGNNVTVAAFRDTSEEQCTAIGYCSTQNYLSLSKSIIYAKSGYIRTILKQSSHSITETTVTAIDSRGYSWNNTEDEITSLVVLASETNGLGIGTSIELYKRVDKI